MKLRTPEVTISILTGLFLVTMSRFLESSNYTLSYTLLLTVTLSTILTLFLSTYYQKRILPISHNVAIIGFPKSGKTTMIVSLFGEIFARNIVSVQAVPKGAKTIERINDSLETLRKGRVLGPTKDQDRFAFRADITIERELTPWTKVKSRLFSKTYKVEFGDFPGENSEIYSEDKNNNPNEKPQLYTPDFFKWVVECDAIIFVIDIGPYLSLSYGKNIYVAEITSAFRSAWQNFVDLNLDRKKDLKKMPIILAFSKADLFGVKKDSITQTYENEIAKLGFGEYTPPIEEINFDALYKGEIRIKNDFKELIDYFSHETSHFKVLFISCFGLYNGKRLGISDLLEAVLP